MGMRILVVEDDMTVALMMEDMLIELGHDVVAVAMRLPAAQKAALDADINMAILDVNLAGLTSFPVAETLIRRGIPFAFVTGYGQAGVEERFASAPVLRKPFHHSELADLVLRAASAS